MLSELMLYWKNRPQTLIDCALDAINYIKLFSEITGYKNYTFNKNKYNIDNDPNAFIKAIVKYEKVQYNANNAPKIKGVTEDFIRDVGNAFGIYTEGKWDVYNPECIDFWFNIGGYEFENWLFMKGQQLQSQNMPLIFKETIKYFKPDWAVITDRTTKKMQDEANIRYTGLQNYLSNSEFEKYKNLNFSSYIFEEIENLGKLIKTSEESIYDSTNVQDLEKVMELYEMYKSVPLCS